MAKRWSSRPGNWLAGLIEENRRVAGQAVTTWAVSRCISFAGSPPPLAAGSAASYPAYRDADPPVGDGGPLFLAGHQPQLFHPGVWFKNFALSALARKWGGQAINLLIDNDILAIRRSGSRRVPSAEPHVISVPMDRVVEAIPFEQREVADAALFGSFADRVRDGWQRRALATVDRAYWKLVLEARRRSPNLGRCLAEARHRLEGRWGQSTWKCR